MIVQPLNTPCLPRHVFCSESAGNKLFWTDREFEYYCPSSVVDYHVAKELAFISQDGGALSNILCGRISLNRDTQGAPDLYLWELVLKPGVAPSDLADLLTSNSADHAAIATTHSALSDLMEHPFLERMFVTRSWRLQFPSHSGYTNIDALQMHNALVTIVGHREYSPDVFHVSLPVHACSGPPANILRVSPPNDDGGGRTEVVLAVMRGPYGADTSALGDAVRLLMKRLRLQRKRTSHVVLLGPFPQHGNAAFMAKQRATDPHAPDYTPSLVYAECMEEIMSAMIDSACVERGIHVWVQLDASDIFSMLPWYPIPPSAAETLCRWCSHEFSATIRGYDEKDRARPNPALYATHGLHHVHNNPALYTVGGVTTCVAGCDFGNVSMHNQASQWSVQPLKPSADISVMYALRDQEMTLPIDGSVDVVLCPSTSKEPPACVAHMGGQKMVFAQLCEAQVALVMNNRTVMRL